MNPSSVVLLAGVALVTSIISAILGMGGGVLLLAVMLCMMPHGEAIPVHAAVQIASNGTRVLAFFGSVDRSAFGRFVLGMVPGAALGLYLLWSLGEPDESEPYLKTLIGAYILIAAYLPKGRAAKKSGGTWWDFPAVGFMAGTAALTVGAVGPLIAPLFARRDFLKERLIATKAVCQVATHAFKIPAFIILGRIDPSGLGLLAGVMIVMVIPGTLIGKRILKDVPDQVFRVGFRVALTLAGLKVLVIDGLVELPFWS